MRKKTVIQAISAAFDARERCRADLDNGTCHESFIPLREEWLLRWGARIVDLCANQLPSGSGFDEGVMLDNGASKQNKLVFVVPYHPMDENGSYDAWVVARVVVKPDFNGIDVSVRGAGEHNDYIGDAMHEAFQADAPDMEAK